MLLIISVICIYEEFEFQIQYFNSIFFLIDIFNWLNSLQNWMVKFYHCLHATYCLVGDENFTDETLLIFIIEMSA